MDAGVVSFEGAWREVQSCKCVAAATRVEVVAVEKFGGDVVEVVVGVGGLEVVA